MTYTKDYLSKNKIAINEKTQEEWDKVMKVMKDWGVVYSDGDEIDEIDEWNYWEGYKENACISLYYSKGKLSFADKDYYQELGFTIRPASEFLADVEPARNASHSDAGGTKTDNKGDIFSEFEKGKGYFEWEKEFDKKFPTDFIKFPNEGKEIEEQEMIEISTYAHSRKGIKDFISHLLAEQRAEIKRDLLKIADEGEYEDLRREVEFYFPKK